MANHQLGSYFTNIEYNDDRPAISVILETANSKEIRILLKEGQMMKSHKAPYPITVQVLSGKVDFGVLDDLYTLNSGDIITLEANIVHDLKAQEDSNVRLTLNKNDSSKRVASVVDQK